MNTYSIVGIIAFVCAIWVIYQVWAVNKSLSSGAKIIWTVFAIFFSIITALVYLVAGKK